MGAWGVLAFENDDASDWVLDLEGTNDFRLVEAAIETLEAEADCMVAAAQAQAVGGADSARQPRDGACARRSVGAAPDLGRERQRLRVASGNDRPAGAFEPLTRDSRAAVRRRAGPDVASFDFCKWQSTYPP